MSVKKSNGKTIGIIVVVTALGLISVGVAYELLFKAKKPAAGSKPAGATGGSAQTPYGNSGTYTKPSGGSSYSPSYAAGFPLKIGSSGSNVKALQQALVDLGANIAVDGQFGSQTQNALIAQTGSATVDSPSALQSLVSQGNTSASTPNYQGSMLAAPVCTNAQYLNSLTPTPASACCTQFFINNA